VTLYFGQGDGTFVYDQTLAVGGTPGSESAGPVLLQDLNGDGAVDLIVGTTEVGDAGVSGFLVFLNRNDGSGGFGAPASYAVAGGGGPTAVYDMNGDGTPDVVGTVAGAAGTYTQVFVMLNQNDGLATFGVPIVCTAGAYAYNATAGDLNRDGKGDIVAENYNGTSPGTIQVLLGQ